MEFKKLISALNGLRIQTGGIICLGCGYEHSCSARGCKIIRETVDTLKLQSKRIEMYSAMLRNAMDFRCEKCEYSRDSDMRCMCDKSQWAGRMVKADNYCGYFEQRNEPLTLEELRQMDGEPVWIKLFDPDEEFWVLRNDWVDTRNPEPMILFHMRWYSHADYGRTWLAYRSKPMEA